MVYALILAGRVALRTKVAAMLYLASRGEVYGGFLAGAAPGLLS
jgi:hypothetical protein